jgi:hypothetical protein
MTIIERHQSLDRQLALLVGLTGDDWTIGFDGFPYHTHGDILAQTEYGGTPEQATRSFVADIIESRRPIVIWRVNGKIRDFHVSHKFDRAELEANIAKYGFPGETFEARYWDGRAVTE